VTLAHRRVLDVLAGARRDSIATGDLHVGLALGTKIARAIDFM
jgi:hypothetical protein